MSDNSPCSPYLDSDNVYRAILYKDWLKANRTKVSHQAFYRLSKDKSGVSVNPAPEYCTIGLNDPIHGIVSLNVGQVRSIERQDVTPTVTLDVIPSSSTHGNIVNLPYRDENRAEATRLAKLLAEIASVLEQS
jgi:hypothetical protein